MFFAMEYFALGDLHQYINSSEGSFFAEKDAKVIVYQLLQGLDIMHGMGFAHRDLKPHVGWLSNSQVTWKANFYNSISRISLLFGVAHSGGLKLATLASPNELSMTKLLFGR
jgi:serine/threonine protein kinase